MTQSTKQREGHVVSDPIVIVGARLLTHDAIPRSVVVTAVHDGVVTCRDEKTGETFAEVAAFAERVWSRRPTAAAR